MKPFLVTVLVLTTFESTANSQDSQSHVPLSNNQASVAQNEQSNRRTDYPENGVQLGSGWRAGTSEKTTARCVTNSETADTAQEKTVEIRSVSDKSSLMRELEISAQVRVKAIVASGTAKTSFTDKVEIKNEYSNFVVRAVVRNGAKYLIPTTAPIDLLPQYKKLAKENPVAFYSECGDSFVSALYGGAELDAVLTFKIHSVDAQQVIKGSVEGSGWNVQASGSVSSTMKTYSAQNELTIFFYQSGGAGDPLPTDQEGLNTAIQNLPQAAVAAPKFFQLDLMRYDALPSWSSIRAGWDDVGYGEIAEQYLRFTTLRDQVESMIDAPLNTSNSFILGAGVFVQDLKNLDDKLLAHLQRLKLAAQKCLDSQGKTCTIDPQDQVSDYEYRILLPVAEDSFAADTEIKKATTVLDAADTAGVCEQYCTSRTNCLRRSQGKLDRPGAVLPDSFTRSDCEAVDNNRSSGTLQGRIFRMFK
jgi:hypothetical protein